MSQISGRPVLSLIFFLLFYRDQKGKLETQAHASAVRHKMSCRLLGHRLYILGGHRQGRAILTPKQCALCRDAYQSGCTSLGGANRNQGRGINFHAATLDGSKHQKES